MKGGNGLEELRRRALATKRDVGHVGPLELLLMREMTHRINNELTSMIGFVSFLATRSTTGDARLALAEVSTHLHEYARVHRALQMPTDNHLMNATA